MYRISVVLIVACALHAAASAGEPANSEKKQDTVAAPSSGFVVVPVIFYAPETRLQGGVAGMYYFHPGDDLNMRPSQISAGAGYTQNKQYQIAVNPDFYFDSEKWRVHGNFGYARFPSKFYGVGGNTLLANVETFTPITLKCSVAVERRMLPGFDVALKYDIRNDKLVALAESGMLASRTLPGSAGGTVSGIGALALLDTRDNIFSASTGSLVEAQVLTYASAIGSDYDYTRYTLDLRHYWPVSDTHIFAVQGYVSLTSGTAPFYLLSLFGGEYRMRGFYLGRYRGNHMALAQAEYRLPVWWRFGAVAFAGIGDVANTFSDFSIGHLKLAAGFGLRYLVDVKERLNIRADIGFGGGQVQPYLTFREAF
jgi:outer membrane protein assembly factor BamA